MRENLSGTRKRDSCDGKEAGCPKNACYCTSVVVHILIYTTRAPVGLFVRVQQGVGRSEESDPDAIRLFSDECGI